MIPRLLSVLLAFWFLVAVGMCTAAISYAHVAHLTGCKVIGDTSKLKSLKPMREPVYHPGTGLLFELYDRDGDGTADLGVMSHVRDVKATKKGVMLKHDTTPLFYFVGEGPDLVFIDKFGNGKCEDIVLYEDLRMPHDRGLDLREQTQTQRGRSL